MFVKYKRQTLRSKSVLIYLSQLKTSCVK